jgi:hypothetical protein
MCTAARRALTSIGCCAVAVASVWGQTLPTGWTATGEGLRSTEIVRDCELAHSGRCSLQLAAPPGTPPVALVQSVSAAEYAGARVTLAAWLRTEQAGAAQLWLRVDGRTIALAFDNMDSRPVTGSTPWSEYRVTLDVPQGAVAVAFGVLLKWGGRAWADDFTLTPATVDIDSTDMLPRDEIWRHLNDRGLPPRARRPVNPGFER